MSTPIRLLYGAIIAVLLSVFLFGGQLAVLYTDWIWFENQAFGQVFTTTYASRIGLGALSAIGCFGFIAANIRLALRQRRPEPIHLLFPSELDDSPVGGVLRALPPSAPFLLITGFVSVVMGLIGAAAWDDVLLYLHQLDFGYSEPIFGYEASFYVFSLPLYVGVRGFLVVVAAIALGVSLLAYFSRGSIELDFVQIEPGQYVVQGVRVDPAARLHIGALVALLFTLMSVGSVLRRFALMFDQNGLFAGPGYTIVNVTMPLLFVEAIATFVGGLMLALAVSQLRRNLAIAGAAVVGGSWALTGLLPQAVQSLSVEPNEIMKESPYIAHHIEASRAAFALADVENLPLSGDATLTANDIAANENTIKNVRLWDHEPLLVTFGQVQEIRTYYDFLSVDNDRYIINGELRQTMLSPRELVPSSLPSATWVNTTQTFTHGYGATLGPVNQVTEQGLPHLFIKDLPPKVLYEDDLAISRPEIYFGEAPDTPVYLRTKNLEFDYPAGEENKYSKYEGKGGISIGNMIDRALVAARLGDMQLFLTNDITPESRVLLYRNIRDRARRLAPFLEYDRDPYMIIDKGRQVWVLDAYTVSDTFPYSTDVRGLGNYMRNSVKVTIDAYDGDVTFYLMDDTDPIVRAWSGIFPDLFVPESQMSDSLRSHIRYPQDYFRIQAHLFALYHMEEPQVFYNREDEWEVPVMNGRRMRPYYMVMKLPGETSEEFILMLPFTPKNKPNLSAWLVARSDGENYGRLRVYSFPKQKLIYGPQQIEGRINQDDVISEKTTLWGQQGSSVVQGTLLVVPIEESLIYVQPLYLQAESGSIPELKRIIVAYENHIAMEKTLEAALAKLFGNGSWTDRKAEIQTLSGSSAGDTTAGSLEWRQVVEIVQGHYAAAESAAREGDWAGYGERTRQLGDSIKRLRDLANEKIDDDGDDEEAAVEDARGVEQ